MRVSLIVRACPPAASERACLIMMDVCVREDDEWNEATSKRTSCGTDARAHFRAKVVAYLRRGLGEVHVSNGAEKKGCTSSEGAMPAQAAYRRGCTRGGGGSEAKHRSCNKAPVTRNPLFEREDGFQTHWLLVE